MTRFTATITAAAAMLLGTALFAATSQRLPDPPPLALKSTFGGDLFQFYCGTCHGPDGRGRAAPSEHHLPPPDLTTLARRNGGIYPRDRVRTTITFGAGNTIASAHGTRDMPVWGAILRGLDPSDTSVEIRIENLVQHIESLQER